MTQQQFDESSGVERLTQFELEATPSSMTAPLVEVDIDRTGFSDVDRSPKTVLRSLVADNGLVAVLEAFQSFVETQVERLQDSAMEPYSKQLNSFKAVSQNLADLIEDLPSELDIELALSQLTHTTPSIEETPPTLVDAPFMVE